MRVGRAARWVGFVSYFAMLAVAEPRRVVLFEELVRIEALRSRSFELQLPQQKAALELGWSVKQPGGAVRVLVVDRRSGTTAFDSGYEAGGSRRLKLDQTGEYQVTVENRQQNLGFSLVDLRLELVFVKESTPVNEQRGPTPARRFWAIATSLALFAMMVTYASVRLAPALRERWRPQNFKKTLDENGWNDTVGE
jgi:hypothetical protein